MTVAGCRLLVEDRRHLGQDRVARRMAVGVVEEAKVVHVDERQAELLFGRQRFVQEARQVLDHGAMVEHPRERIPPGRFHQCAGLALQAAVGGSEDEVEEDRQHGGRHERDQQHLLARLRALRQDRGRVAIHLEDGLGRAVHGDRQIFLEQEREAEARQVRLGVG